MKMKVFLSALAGGALIAFPAQAELKGDSQAIALADQMIESIGGKAVWSKIRTLYVVEKSRTPTYGDGIIAEFWRDLLVPQERYSIQNENISYTKSWTVGGGWTLRNGEFKTKSAEEVAADEGYYWPGEIYIIYGRLARDDDTLRLEKGEDPRSFVVYELASGRKLSTFWLNVDGDMYRWRHGNESDLTEYVYGPHVDFGEISFPAWGTMYDGSWSFSYVEVRGYTEDMEIDYTTQPE
ncbi:MAG: hypothetical protein V3R64_03215 [Sphingomonadales bacterium]